MHLKTIMKRGLTLGKFAPLHKGHEFLLKTALSEVDELYVLIYDTDVISVPLQVRAGWIKELFPTIIIIEAWDGPEGYGDTPEIKKVQEEYILKRLGTVKITHFYSSEFYGDHVSKALGAIDRRVDEARRVIPISGTALRKNTFGLRAYLSDIVYKDLVLRVCFLGAPSTGKSTLTIKLSALYDTEYMPEYGAEFWLENQINRRITLDQFELIAPEHHNREDELVLQSNGYLFCDTCAITTYMFAKDYHGMAGPVLTQYAKMAEKRYDLFFLCDTDIPYHDTWERSGNQKRQWFQNQIIGDLKERKIPFIRLAGTLEERVQKVQKVLRDFEKYDTILDH